jgi:hypothetical protein
MAVIKRLPRWSLPYLGIILMPYVMLSAYPLIWESILPLFNSTFGSRAVWSIPTRFLYSAVTDFMALFLVLLSALLLVNLLRIIPFSRGLWQAIRSDWTTLSFMLYGGLLFLVTWLFDAYVHNEIWSVAAWMGLALGAWLYLRAGSQKMRILSLIGGATVSLWIVTIGTWVIIPLQLQWIRNPTPDIRLEQTAAVPAIWIAAILILLAPALLTLLPPKANRAVPDGKASAAA